MIQPFDRNLSERMYAPMNSTLLYVVRHGQSEYNLSRRFTGQSAVPLTALGRQQAENTAAFLQGIPLDAIYSSDLSRAMDTALPTARMHGLEVLPDREIRELFAGDWEGHTYDELDALFPVTHKIWVTDLGNARPEGGESVREVSARSIAEIGRIAALHRGGCVALFTHSIPIRTLLCHWKGIPVERIGEVGFVSNASISTVRVWEDGHADLLSVGFDAHQGRMSTNFASKNV